MNRVRAKTAIVLLMGFVAGCPGPSVQTHDGDGADSDAAVFPDEDVSVLDASESGSTDSGVFDSNALDVPVSDVPSPDDTVDALPPGDATDASDGGDAGAGLRGVLLSDTEQPIANTMVLACTTVTCFVSQSGADGSFVFSLAAPVNVALKTLENANVTPRRGAMLYPVRVPDSTLVEMGNVYVPALPDGVPIGAASRDPQTLTGGDGLTLTLRRADLVAPLGTDIFDLATRAILPARFPHYDALGSEQVIAVFAMHPFGVTSSSPIAVSAPSTLAAGTAVNFRTVSEIDGHLSPPVPGHADGTHVTTDLGTGITELSSLVISQ